MDDFLIVIEFLFGACTYGRDERVRDWVMLMIVSCSGPALMSGMRG